MGEKRSSEVYFRCTTNDRSRIIRAVVDEQCRQRELSVSDPDRIAHVSRTLSMRSRTFANYMAEADAAEAIRTWKKNSSSSSTSVLPFATTAKTSVRAAQTSITTTPSSSAAAPAGCFKGTETPPPTTTSAITTTKTNEGKIGSPNTNNAYLRSSCVIVRDFGTIQRR